jgi:flagellar hook-associated protein 2
MSSPISLSNFNGIDFNVILNAVMTQESQPLLTMQAQHTALSFESSAYGVLATKLGALETAAAGLSAASDVIQFATTTSDKTAVAAVATGTAIAGSYDVVVKALAKAQVTASSSTTDDTNTTVVASGGSITVGGLQVDISGAVTLQGLADQINAKANMPATASVVESAPGKFRLILTSANTGLANGFTVSGSLTGGGGVAFDDPNAQEAADASVTVNSLEIRSSSNTLSSAIPGTTLSLFQADPAKHIAVAVTPDNSALGAKIQTLASAYNELVAYIQSQKTAAANGQTGTLANEAILGEARNALRSALGGTYGTGAFTHLAEVGIGFDQTGKLTLDQTALTTALTRDRASVVTLFAGTGTDETGLFTNGAFGGLQKAIDAFTQTGGFVSSAQTLITSQQSRLAQRIADMQARLAVESTRLQQEYTAADQAMATLKAQSATLASVSSSQAASSLVTNG